MPKKSNKNTPPFMPRLKNKPTKVATQKKQWTILAILVVSVIAAQVSGLYPYLYSYAQCHSEPLEIRGRFYVTPADNTYGIHPGSDYSRCGYDIPAGLERDPSSQIAIAIAKNQAADKERQARLTAAYDVYTPKGYQISDIRTSAQGDGVESTFTVTTASNRKFSVREMKKDSDFSYTNLCSKPATQNWSGTIIGTDAKGREVCKTNISKYVTDYIVGINIDNTAIMLQIDNESEAALNAEAIAIFGAMELHTNQ